MILQTTFKITPYLLTLFLPGSGSYARLIFLSCLGSFLFIFAPRGGPNLGNFDLKIKIFRKVWIWMGNSFSVVRDVSATRGGPNLGNFHFSLSRDWKEKEKIMKQVGKILSSKAKKNVWSRMSQSWASKRIETSWSHMEPCSSSTKNQSSGSI